MITKIAGNTALSVLILFLISCTSPRNIIASGKVTSKGTFKAGVNSSFNIATVPLTEIDDITKAAVNAIDANKDSIFYNETAATLTRGLVAYSLDPVTPTFDVYVRYGLVERVDVGYRYASGAHVFDAMYQFLGSTGTPDDPEATKGMHGSIGIQYSGQNANLPSKVGLNTLGSLFNYELSRKDILIPLVFSIPVGPEETYGNFSFGVAYGRSSIKYGFNPSKQLVRYVGNQIEKIPAFSNKQSYSSFGAFINGKIGYKYAYFLPAISMYYQNYGTYNLFNLQKERYKGVTFIPSIGLQLNLGFKKKGTD
ncbi:MAG TPA: hypothetical protein VM888_08265, partial [Chitinophagaceae bacterium]|nr:hypothetical protein [Chitinophagaceae bacterium]